jgi:hypothetical protein
MVPLLEVWWFFVGFPWWFFFLEKNCYHLLAFTPTCSSTHLPGYEDAYETIKSLGIDEVYCLSVNDAFVMRQVTHKIYQLHFPL